MKIRYVLGAAAALCTAAGTLAQPANDNCTGAQSVAVPSVTGGNLTGATIDPGPPQTCTTTVSIAPGVWYTLVGTGNTLTVNTCTGGNGFDSKILVYCTTSATPCDNVTSFFCVAGNDDFSGCGTGFTLRSSVTFCSALGQTYYILVQQFSTATNIGTGDFNLTVTEGASCSTAGSCTPTTLGACCNNTTQVCTITASTACTGGTHQGAGTACTYVSPCPGVGACCSGTGTCTIALPANCTGTSTHLGVGTACLPTNPCTALLGACCNNTTQACSNTTLAGCPSGSTFQGAGTVCGINLCPGTGACCSGTGTCTVTLPGSCTGTSTFLGAGTPCLPTNPCTALLGACCSGTGTCTTTTTAGCAVTSAFLGVGTTCTPTNPCTALVGACCSSSLTCTVTFSPMPMGTPAGCTAAGSVFQGLGTTCTPNPCSGACCTTGASPTCSLAANATACAGVFKGLGSTCSPLPCPSTSSPANDECASAEVIPNGSLPASANGNNAAASTDPMPAVCATSYRDMWYTFTPLITQNYSVRTCGGLTGTLDTVLSVHSSCPTPAANNLVPAPNCNDDGCSGIGASQIPSIALNAGTTYYIRVARFGTSGAGGPFTVTIDELTGTCCDPTTGACTITTAVGCGMGTWTFGGTCTTTTCAGRCCAADASCTTLASTAGCAPGTTYGGVGSTCTPNTCPVPSGACCDDMGGCTIELSTACTGTSLFAGPGSTCTPGICDRGSCVVTGTPCDTCTITLASTCVGGTFTSGGTCPTLANDNCSSATVIPNTSLPVTVMGTSCGATNDGSNSSCVSSALNTVWWSFTPTHTASYMLDTCGTGYDTVLSVWEGLCGSETQLAGGCDDDEPTCSPSTLASKIAALTLNAGTTYLVRVGSFSVSGRGPITLTINANSALGSCCAADGSCTQTDAANCADTFNAGGTCSPNTCPQPNGACCCGSTCSITAPGACTGTNQYFAGSGTVCNVYGVNNETPCCFADYNQSGMVSVQDIFDFLAAYFAGDLCTDINNSGAPPSVQDIFDFLAAYFAGCV